MPAGPLPAPPAITKAAELRTPEEHAECEAKITAAMVALENQDLSGVRLIHAMGEPGQWNDAENRTCMSVNFRAVVDA